MEISSEIKQKQISILIPALNEEEVITRTIEEIPDIGAEIIVINNGSTDNTARRAASSNAKVIFEPRRGYGYACLSGINYLKNKNQAPDLVIFLDADGSDDPKEIIKLLRAKYSAKKPDLVINSRFDQIEYGAMSAHAIAANKVFAKLINFIYRVNLTDMGPLRAIDYITLIDLNMSDTGYGWTSEMIVKALKNQYSIMTVPTKYRVRVGQSKISGSIITSIKAAIWITIHILRYAIRR